MLAVTFRRTPASISIGSSTVRRMRSTTFKTLVSRLSPGRMMINSSPPNRADAVLGAHLMLHPFGDDLEDSVSRGMTIAIIDRLEVIKIDEHDNDLRMIGLCWLDTLLQFEVDGMSIEQPR